MVCAGAPGLEPAGLGRIRRHEAVGHGVAFQAAGLGLDAEIVQRLFRRGTEAAHAGRINADAVALADGHFLTIHKERASPVENDIQFFIVLVRMHKGNAGALGQGVAGNFTACQLQQIVQFRAAGLKINMCGTVVAHEYPPLGRGCGVRSRRRGLRCVTGIR